MKSFYQFQEDAAGATKAAISASGSYDGSSSANAIDASGEHKSIDWIGKKKKAKEKREKKVQDLVSRPSSWKNLR